MWRRSPSHFCHIHQQYISHLQLNTIEVFTNYKLTGNQFFTDCLWWCLLKQTSSKFHSVKSMLSLLAPTSLFTSLVSSSDLIQPWNLSNSRLDGRAKDCLVSSLVDTVLFPSPCLAFFLTLLDFCHWEQIVRFDIWVSTRPEATGKQVVLWGLHLHVEAGPLRARPLCRSCLLCLFQHFQCGLRCESKAVVCIYHNHHFKELEKKHVHSLLKLKFYKSFF